MSMNKTVFHGLRSPTSSGEQLSLPFIPGKFYQPARERLTAIQKYGSLLLEFPPRHNNPFRNDWVLSGRTIWPFRIMTPRDWRDPDVEVTSAAITGSFWCDWTAIKTPKFAIRFLQAGLDATGLDPEGILLTYLIPVEESNKVWLILDPVSVKPKAGDGGNPHKIVRDGKGRASWVLYIPWTFDSEPRRYIEWPIKWDKDEDGMLFMDITEFWYEPRDKYGKAKPVPKGKGGIGSRYVSR